MRCKHNTLKPPRLLSNTNKKQKGRLPRHSRLRRTRHPQHQRPPKPQQPQNRPQPTLGRTPQEMGLPIRLPKPMALSRRTPRRRPNPGRHNRTHHAHRRHPPQPLQVLRLRVGDQPARFHERRCARYVCG